MYVERESIKHPSFWWMLIEGLHNWRFTSLTLKRDPAAGNWEVSFLVISSSSFFDVLIIHSKWIGLSWGVTSIFGHFWCMWFSVLVLMWPPYARVRLLKVYGKDDLTFSFHNDLTNSVKCFYTCTCIRYDTVLNFLSGDVYTWNKFIDKTKAHGVT